MYEVNFAHLVFCGIFAAAGFVAGYIYSIMKGGKE